MNILICCNNDHHQDSDAGLYTLGNYVVVKVGNAGILTSIQQVEIHTSSFDWLSHHADR